jgi:hypothetical protein
MTDARAGETIDLKLQRVSCIDGMFNRTIIANATGL